MITGSLLLASWPRSGNTMLRAVLWHCFGQPTASQYIEDAHGFRGVLDSGLLGESVASVKSPLRAVKTHAISHSEGLDPAIYVVRDGREACVSYWHFYRGIMGQPNAPLRAIIMGHCNFGSWRDHLLAWRPKDRPNTCLVRYEDMLTRLPDVVSVLANFLDCEPIGYTIPSFGEFRKTHPAFFRAGTNETWKTELIGGDLAMFERVHGGMMREYGYTN
jgi:hypothetical protein